MRTTSGDMGGDNLTESRARRLTPGRRPGVTSTGVLTPEGRPGVRPTPRGYLHGSVDPGRRPGVTSTGVLTPGHRPGVTSTGVLTPGHRPGVSRPRAAMVSPSCHPCWPGSHSPGLCASGWLVASLWHAS